MSKHNILKNALRKQIIVEAKFHTKGDPELIERFFKIKKRELEGKAITLNPSEWFECLYCEGIFRREMECEHGYACLECCFPKHLSEPFPEEVQKAYDKVVDSLMKEGATEAETLRIANLFVSYAIREANEKVTRKVNFKARRAIAEMLKILANMYEKKAVLKIPIRLRKKKVKK